MVEEQGSVTVWDAIDRKGNGFEGSEVGKMHNYMLRVEKFTLRPGKRQDDDSNLLFDDRFQEFSIFAIHMRANKCSQDV